jgi:hypothetical protein
LAARELLQGFSLAALPRAPVRVGARAVREALAHR